MQRSKPLFLSHVDICAHLHKSLDALEALVLHGLMQGRQFVTVYTVDVVSVLYQHSKSLAIVKPGGITQSSLHSVLQPNTFASTWL